MENPNYYGNAPNEQYIQQQPQQNNYSSYSGSLSYPNQVNDAMASVASLSKLLLESSRTLTVLRREFRGEAIQEFSDGSTSYIQVSKPVFIKIDYETGKPIKRKVKFRDSDGQIIDKEEFIPNDEAIEEILSMLKFAGVNQITSITNIDEGTIMDDLLEFECKLAATLCLKQKEWGIDKELLPMIQFKIKTIVQDARFMACEGHVLKALQTTIQRVEQAFEGERTKGGRVVSPYA